MRSFPVWRRRRGDVLESALLEAAWEELAEHGYDALTIDAVATRAGTSRPVVYRRWAGKRELVLAAIAHLGAQEHRPPADTGSLRGDLIALLDKASPPVLDLPRRSSACRSTSFAMRC